MLGNFRRHPSVSVAIERPNPRAQWVSIEATFRTRAPLSSAKWTAGAEIDNKPVRVKQSRPGGMGAGVCRWKPQFKLQTPLLTGVLKHKSASTPVNPWVLYPDSVQQFCASMYCAQSRGGSRLQSGVRPYVQALSQLTRIQNGDLRRRKFLFRHGPATR